ncbi:MAG: GDSL family lipase [Ruminococcaceae bacterium]|nr:GDSL family lipase [Oscillospiraceae bacterium]
MKILFFGDSITDADRNKTPNATPSNHMGQGYASLIHAKLGKEYPEKNYTFCNKGIGGDRLSELYARLERDVVLEKPDLVSIFVGINDCGFYSVWGLDVDVQRFKKLYHNMIHEIRSFLPDVKFMICEPTFYPAGSRKDDETHIGDMLPPVRQAVREVAEEQGIPFVALQDKFTALCEKGNPEYWLWDGIHPSLSGHQLIADEWISVFLENF